MRIFILLIILITYPICATAQEVNKVVAVVNNEVITKQDVDQLLGVLYAQYVHEYTGDELLQKMEEVKKDILRQIIEDKLILSRAKELNIKIREEEIEVKLTYIKDGFPSEEEFFKVLDTQGITVADLKNRYRDQLMMKKVVDFEVSAKADVLPSEVREYYEKHREDYKLDTKYKVSHILVKAEGEVGFELAKVEAQDIYNRLKDSHDFNELATKYSQGPNKEQGGDMGYVEEGEMLKELDEAMVALGPGEFSSPVKSQIGYHILKVEDIKSLGYRGFEELQNNIKNMLMQKRFKERLKEWLGELRKEAYISIK